MLEHFGHSIPRTIHQIWNQSFWKAASLICIITQVTKSTFFWCPQLVQQLHSDTGRHGVLFRNVIAGISKARQSTNTLHDGANPSETIRPMWFVPYYTDYHDLLIRCLAFCSWVGWQTEVWVFELNTGNRSLSDRKFMCHRIIKSSSLAHLSSMGTINLRAHSAQPFVISLSKCRFSSQISQ